MQLPQEPPTVSVDLANGTVTVVVDLTNPGDSAAQGEQVELTADALTLDSVDAGPAGPALRGSSALSFGVAAAGCQPSICSLPDIPARSTVPITITLKLADDAVLQDYSGAELSIAGSPLLIPLNLSVTMELPALSAGSTVAAQLMVSFPNADVPTMGDVFLPTRSGDVIFAAADSSCLLAADDTGESAADELRCVPTANSDRTFTVVVAATALPQADAHTAITPRIGRFTLPQVDVDSQSRAPADPIDMTGPFRAATISEATTHCLSVLLCHYHAEPRELDVGAGTIISAELTWIADTQQPSLATPVRPFLVGGDTEQAVGHQIGNHTYAADVTDLVQQASEVSTTLEVAMPPTTNEPGLGPRDRTGWGLTVIWMTDGPDQDHRIETRQPIEPVEPRERYVVAEPGNAVSGVSVLTLWDPLSTSGLLNGYAGAWCRLPMTGGGVFDQSCGSGGWPTLREEVDGSVILELTPVGTPIPGPEALILGPTVIERPVPPS